MAKVSVSCELMENAFPARDLQLNGKFFVAEDERGENMIFSVDGRGKLCLIVKGLDGHNELIDLSQTLGVPDTFKVGTLAVSQNKSGLIHLVFAAGEPGHADKLYLLNALAPVRNIWADAAVVQKALLSGEQWSIKVRDILLATNNDDQDSQRAYPLVFLVFTHLGRTTEDIWALEVNNETGSWFNQKKFQMPCNPGQIIDMCVGNLRSSSLWYRGLFVLYRETAEVGKEGKLLIRFVGLDIIRENSSLVSIEIPVPRGAHRLASFDNADGCTDLLVAGTSLTWRSAHKCLFDSKGKIDVLDKSPTWSLIEHFKVAQSETALSVWGLDRNHGLSYQEFAVSENNSPEAKTVSIPLLEQKELSDSFFALQHPGLGQKLFVMDETGILRMLEQNVETGLWQRPLTIAIPTADEIIQFSSHTVTLQIESQKGEPLCGQTFLLCPSTSAEMLVNGKSIRGDPSGIRVMTDESGTLTIIIRADNLTAPVLTLRDLSPHVELLGQLIVIDPMRKLWETISETKTVDDLKKMELPDGTKFIRPGMNDKELEKALQALQNLNQVREELISPETSKSMSTVVEVVATSVADRIWGAWYWVRDRFEEVYDWSVKKFQQGWKFVVTIAGKVWEFVLENFPQIAEAVQTILAAISNGYDWLKKKFEFVFNWSDILKVKNLFVNLTNQGLLWGVDSITHVELGAKSFFDDLRAKVKILKTAKLPDGLSKLDPTSMAKMEEGEKVQVKASKSSPAQYGLYHLKHSSGGVTGSPTQGQSTLDRLMIRLGKVWDELKHLTSQFGENLSKVIKSGDFSVESLRDNLGLDLLDGLLGVLEKVVTGVIGMLGDLLLELADTMNTAIDIPVLSSLYTKLTGSRLSVLDAFCLCFAIISTVVYKTAFGSSPLEGSSLEHLTKLDLVKPEIDARMGRLAKEAGSQKETSPQSHGRLSDTAMDHHDSLEFAQDTDGPVDPTLSQRSLEISSQVKELPSGFKQMSSSKAPSSVQPRNFANGPPGTRLPESGSKLLQDVADSYHLLRQMIPTATYAWHSCWTIPHTLWTDPEGSIKSRFGSASISLLLWLAHIGMLMYPVVKSPEHVPGLEFDLAEKLIPQWNHRFYIWCASFMPIVGAFGGKQIKYGVTLFSNTVNTLQVMVMHIDAWAFKDGYSGWLATDDYLSLLTKIATSYTGVTNGGQGYGYAAAHALSLSSLCVKLKRVDQFEKDHEAEIQAKNQDAVNKAYIKFAAVMLDL